MASDGFMFGGAGDGRRADPGRGAAAGGLAIVVGTGERRRAAAAAVAALGLTPVEYDDPYAAMADLCRRPAADVAAIVLGLQSLYREELRIVPAVRRARPGTEVWLTDLDARPAALAEAVRLGVDALLGEDGLHRMADDDDDVGVARPDPVATTAAVPPEPTPVRAPPVRRVGRHAEPAPSGRPATGRGSAGSDAGGRPAVVVTSAVARSPGAVGGNGHRPAADSFPGEPLLSAEELRALLGDPDPSAGAG